MYEQNTSMMNTSERNTFLLPAMVEGDFSSVEIAEDADGLQMMSFQRVKIPAGGALQFEIPTEDPDNPDYPSRSPDCCTHKEPSDNPAGCA